MSKPNETYSRGEGIGSVGFLSLVATQFLTAVNDHTFRWYAVGLAKDFAPEGEVQQFQSFVMAMGAFALALPALMLAAPAGFLADRFSKRSVIVGCKAAELGVLAIGLLGVAIGNVYLMFVALVGLGVMTTLFVPAKIGAIPEILDARYLSKANGLFQLVTIVAMVAGAVLGSYLADVAGDRGTGNLTVPGMVFFAVAIGGVVCSLGIGKLWSGDPSRNFPWNFPKQTFFDLRLLFSQKALFRVTLGIMFFYAVGVLAQMNIDRLATEGGAATESAKSPLLVALIMGVSLGALLAGLWSGDRVELGILPIGAAGVAMCAVMMFTVPAHLFEPGLGNGVGYYWALVLLLGLGVSAGLFLIPLESYLQHHSEPTQRGSILAAANFICCCGTLATSVLFFLLAYAPGMTPRHIFLFAGVITLPVLAYTVWLLPDSLIRFVVWLAAHTVYRIRVRGREHLPVRGGALITPNHVSWADAVLLLLTSSRPMRMMAWSGNFENRTMRYLAKLFDVILVNPAKPKMIVAAMREARAALDRGELVCLFPEGGISRTGQLLGFKPGLLKIVDGADAPVVPVYLDGLWGSIFSFERGRFFWKLPKRIPYPVAIHFGPPLNNVTDVHPIRQAVAQLGTQAVQSRVDSAMLLPQAFIRRCKSRKWRSKVADTMGADLTGGQLLMRTLILRRLLRRVLADDEKVVGLLLPPSAPGFIANMSLTLDGRVTANLNYTVSSEVMNKCIRAGGIKRIITSRKFMSKMSFSGLEAELVYLEDFKDKVTLADKIAGATAAYAMPAAAIERSLGLGRIKADDLATLIFTSGSTGTPKGVMISHGNLLFNVEAINQAVHLTSNDVLLGVLPFFHVFGYTVSMWAVAGLDVKGAYHYSPLDAKQIGKLCKEHRGTLLLSTPTFLRSYLRRCEPEDFATLDVVVTGAEKLPPDVAAAFKERFGVEPVEGYGATETTPLVSVNIPPSRSRGQWHVDCKPGTVGRPVSGVAARIVSLETGEVLGPNESGMLQVSGPNIMQGYWQQQDLTDEVLKEGWYVTGDVAKIDEDGFIQITGRESRFSKIGGEMVPHIQIEELLNQLLGASDDEMKAAVTAVHDPRKGERLVVLHTQIDKSPEELRKGLTEVGMPNLFLPAADSFFEVGQIPVLGTGKLDLKGLKTLAEEKTAEERAVSR
jgi:acyl-[acyl-carrier-protein]-phospholipid O-acyltransferase / long-chain-fatty-acid--[acyl-carrier-protein] ligase